VSGGFGQRVRLNFQLLLQHGGGKSDSRQILADVVVQISPDALLLTFTDGDDFLLELLSTLEEFQPGADVISLLLEDPPSAHHEAEKRKAHDCFPKPQPLCCVLVAGS